jgi:hypothetical protein
MNHASAIAAVIAGVLASLSASPSWAADPAGPATAQSPAKTDADPAKPAEVQKTKTKSNQSND